MLCVEEDRHKFCCNCSEVSICDGLETLCDQESAVHMKNETALMYQCV